MLAFDTPLACFVDALDSGVAGDLGQALDDPDLLLGVGNLSRLC